MTSEHQREIQQFEAAKRETTFQLLFKTARLVNSLAVAEIRQATGKPLRAVHTSLFPHIDLAGTRLTVLAKRMGISKQGAGQLVNELVDMGVLCQIADPSDGRAKLICFNRGTGELMAGLTLLKDLENRFAAEIGTSTMHQLKIALQKLAAALAQKNIPAGAKSGGEDSEKPVS